MSRADQQATLDAFGAQVRKLRVANGMSQEELAAHAGVHRTYIGMVERGEKNTTLLSMKRIATALGISVAALLESTPDGE